MSGERHLDMGALEVDDACSRWRVAISDDVVIGEVAVDDQPRRGAVAAVFQVADQPPARRRITAARSGCELRLIRRSAGKRLLCAERLLRYRTCRSGAATS